MNYQESQAIEALFPEKTESTAEIQSLAEKARLFCKLVELFEQEGIEYCVVGDVRNLPDRIESDVDIVISRKQLKPLVYNLINALPWARTVRVAFHEQTAYTLLLAPFKDERYTPVCLSADLCSDYYKDARFFLDAESLLSDRERFSEDHPFQVPAPAMAFIYYLIKRVEKMEITSEQGTYLSEQFYQNLDGAMKQVYAHWPQESAIMILESARDNNWQPVHMRMPRLRQELRESLKKLSPMQHLREFTRLINRFHRTGLWIAYLGADGSGKSTVRARVDESIGEFFEQYRQYHLRPSYLQQYNAPATPVDDPHGKPPRGLLVSLAKLVWWWLDYMLGYWLKIWPKLMRTSLIIFDRYAVDLLIDPLRFRYSGPKGLVALLLRVIPQPDLYILLDAPAEVLQARKQEVGPEESERQRHAYLDWAARRNNCRIIDASRPLEAVVSDVEQEVLSYMRQRTVRRYGK